ncbi:MAG: alkaline phosphatase family protein [Prevotellaceae bacterium]|jgi:predicted AlkP superfamily pyrophosphatase or phosphodiesterase|nr:alkaline phosphatase family protein [Prevotellaceae bacterium]
MISPKNRLLIILITLFSVNSAFSQALERPRLVVGIVVDQMRWDYLYRFYDRYGAHGFRRMLNEGLSCQNAMINYLPSYTAVGHATVYTGSVPSLHGIAANNFYRNSTGESIYCTQDNSVRGVGCPDPNATQGRMSPKNLQVTTITDELKLATNFRSKVVGIAIKDRGSILPAGHAADAAYWFDYKSGNWITSTWYRESLPKWLENYNEKKSWKKYIEKDWTTLYPIETYIQSTPDRNNYEEQFVENQGVEFPIKSAELSKTQGEGFMICQTPYGNAMTLDVAQLAVENEQLGADKITDFLTVSFSSPDYIGHRFGANSAKVEDNYLRLDHDLGEFLKFLDAKIGRDNYLVFLTSDHAGAHNGQFLLDNKIAAGNWEQDIYADSLNSYLAKKFDAEKIVRNLDNYQINFDIRKIDSLKLDFEKIREESVKYMSQFSVFQYVVDLTKISEAVVPAKLREMIINGYNREFSGAVQLVLKAGFYSDSDLRGATHGSWNPYDTHIPLLFFGWGINKATTTAEVHMTDIAATIAAMLHIQMPSACIGKPVF